MEHEARSGIREPGTFLPLFPFERDFLRSRNPGSNAFFFFSSFLDIRSILKRELNLRARRRIRPMPSGVKSLRAASRMRTRVREPGCEREGQRCVRIVPSAERGPSGLPQPAWRFPRRPPRTDTPAVARAAVLAGARPAKGHSRSAGRTPGQQVRGLGRGVTGQASGWGLRAG